MSRRDVAVLAFTITGIYLLVQSVQPLQQFLYYMGTLLTGGLRRFPSGSDGVRSFLFAAMISAPAPAVLLGGGYVLIRWRRELAERLFPGPPSEPAEKRFLGLHALAYSVIGVFVTADAIPELVQSAAEFAVGPRTRLMIGGTTGSGWISVMSLIAGVVQLAIGIGLFFGSHSLVRIWSRLRYAGIREQMGICLNCGYDLSGNTTGTCPECGTPAPPAQPRPSS